MILRSITLVLLLLLPSAAVAQREPSAPKACTFDTAAVTKPVRVMLGLADTWFAPIEGGDSRLLIAQAIGEQFRAPKQISLPLAMRVEDQPRKNDPRDQTPALRYGLHTLLAIHLDDSGRVMPNGIAVSSASTELNEALADAVRRADSVGSLRMLDWRSARDGSGRVVLRTGQYVPGSRDVVPLAALGLEVLVPDEAPEPIRIPKPEFPRKALMERRSGWVDFQYVITEDGVIDEGSLRVVAGHQEFVAPSVKVLLAGRFRTAKIRGCPVPIMVQQRISYNIG